MELCIVLIRIDIIHCFLYTLYAKVISFREHIIFEC